MSDNKVIGIINNQIKHTSGEHYEAVYSVMNRIRDVYSHGINLFNDYLLRHTLLFR